MCGETMIKQFPKTPRIKDKQAIEKARKDYCEICYARNVPFHVHHVRTKGASGDDIPSNLLNLCIFCHNKVHDGNIPKEKLLEIVERRRV